MRLSGGAKIAGLSHVPAPGQQVKPSDLGPADLRSNGETVMLGKGTEVYGDVLTSGRLEVEPGANLTVGPEAPVTPLEDSVWVRGAVKSGEGEPPIAAVNLTRFDPVALGLGHSTLQSDRYDEAYSVSDSKRRQGSVEFSSGLQMDGGLLFVDGDLTVRGGLTGSGLVVCTGRVSVEGASSLSSGSGVALVAGGEVGLTGSGSGGSYFQGLVYTDTGFSADKVSLVGPLVSRGTGAVELREAQLLMPESVPKDWKGGRSGEVPQGNIKIDEGNGQWHPTIHVEMQDSTHLIVHLAGEFQTRPVTRQVILDLTDRNQSALDLAEMLAAPGALPPQQVSALIPGSEPGEWPRFTLPELLQRIAPADANQPIDHDWVLDSNQFFRLQDRIREVLLMER